MTESTPIWANSKTKTKLRRFSGPGLAGAVVVLFFCGLSGLPVPPLKADPIADLTLPEVLSKIDDAQRKIQDVQLDFSENIRNAAGPATILSGALSFKKPYHLRIDQRRPEKQTLVTDGKALSIYSPAAGQEMTGSWTGWIQQTHFPLALFTFSGDVPVNEWSSSYSILFGGYASHLYKITLKALKGDSQITLWFSDETFFPVDGRLETGADTVDVAFSNVKANRGLSSKRFIQQIPDGTPIVPLTL